MRAIITVLLFLTLAGITAAQDLRPGAGNAPQQSTTNGMAAQPAAPVGHRQPTEKNLMPQVRQRETSPPVDPLGPLPQICKNC